MSAAVARLRKLLDDLLFVRSGAEMKPTPQGLGRRPSLPTLPRSG